jgi:Chitobiase/beta-hexosaminidase C-terminal domain
VAYGQLSGTAPSAATPTFSPGAGTYSGPQSVTISEATPSATVFYTTDGTTPTTASLRYTGPITINSSETLKAIAVANGLTNSAVGSATYNISSSGGGGATATPTFTPLTGTYTGAQSVTITDATAGASIYYTTNGTTPTTASAVYTGPISVSASETIEAIAVASGHTASAVAVAAYTITTGTGGGGTPPAINNPTGFTSATNFALVGGVRQRWCSVSRWPALWECFLLRWRKPRRHRIHVRALPDTAQLSCRSFQESSRLRVWSRELPSCIAR